MSFRARIDSVVIGAGVVGLAVARQLAAHGRETIIVDAGDTIGGGVSSRNSEVVHAGLYYSPGSLKAQACTSGRKMLYDYCRERDIPHARTGKLVVATERSQLEALQAMKARAHRNGVTDVTVIPAAAAHDMEPALFCVGALLSPDSGIVDSHSFMTSLLGDAETSGAVLALKTPVLRIASSDQSISVECGGEMPCVLDAEHVVNCAGLSAPALAAMIWRDAPQATAKFAKGNYFGLTGTKAPFSRLVYPVPEPGGLGVHFTIDLGGQAKFGPDVEWIDEEAYDVSHSRLDQFYARIREYWPALPDGALSPAYAGIRPKLKVGDTFADDFVIAGPETHGMRGIVHMLGIESPGLTASLSLAKLVTARLGLG